MAELNVYQKLQAIRATIVRDGTKKSGKNPFSNYSYFELDDFLPGVMLQFEKYGLCSVVSFPSRDTAMLTIVNSENPVETIVFSAPMGTANLKACHDAQNVGAAETYARRYLYIAALELTEHDALDSGESAPEEPKPLIDVKKNEIGIVIEKIKAVDEKYRENVVAIIRKRNKSAKYMNITDLNRVMEVLNDLNEFYNSIAPKEEA